MDGCNKISAQVWNLCIKLSEEYKKNNDGQWIDRNKLQKMTKKCVDFHSKCIHHVVHKFIYARDAILKAKNNGNYNLEYPYKTKKLFVTGWDAQCIRTNQTEGFITLAMPVKLDANGIFRKQTPLKCYLKNPPENIAEIELIYRDKLYLAIKYKEDSVLEQVLSNNAASIDLGEIHAITSIDSLGNAIIITGREMRSIKFLRNKSQAAIYSKMSKCEKGSSQYKKYLIALNNLKVNTDLKIRDCVHKITKMYLDFCLENQISKVYYGDLDSATRDTKINKKVGRFTRQKLSQWNYGEVMTQLEIKLNRHGIKLVKVKEYYTSQKCPSCKTLNKPKGREYICDCGYTRHRDIVGAINILNDNEGTKIVHYISKKYLQIT